MKTIKYTISVFASLFIICGCVTLSASANWYDEVSGGTYQKIVGDPFVSETFCGVEARYRDTGINYQCNELVMRFYRDAYGLSVGAFPESLGGLSMESDGYEFVTPDVPHPGDVIFAPSKFRNGVSDHWAIVKSYSGGKITLFEQNVVYQGKAGTGRKLNYPSQYYYIYTPKALPGYPDPVLKNAPPAVSQTTPPATEKPVTTTVKPVTTTSKPAETTTLRPVTTAVHTTVITTRMPASTSAVTTVPAETSSRNETSSAPVTSTGQTETAASEAVPAESITESLCTTAEDIPEEAIIFRQDETTAEASSEAGMIKKPADKRLIPLFGAAGLLAAVIAAAVIVMKKRK